MPAYGFDIITEGVIEGPWQVGSKHDHFWYIINTINGKKRKIGPVRKSGTNYYDRAHAEAIRRNKLITV